MRLSDIAKYLGVTYNGKDVELDSMNDLHSGIKGQLSFAEHKKYAVDLRESRASAFIIVNTLIEHLPRGSSYIICENVPISMAYVTKLFAKKVIDVHALAPRVGKGSYVDSKAHLERGAVIGSNVTILAGAYIGSHVYIDDNSMIYPNVTIYRDCIVGKSCIIHAGTVIGADGFGFSHTDKGEHIKIYQNGNVIIEDDVELGANCAIDRAMFGSTIIKQGAKFDNFIHIGHNCEIGEHSILVAQVGVGGSTTLGRNCLVSGQTAFSDHLDIAPYTTFTARSGVTKSIKESGKVFSGYPLMEHREWRKLQSHIAKLTHSEE